MGVRAGGQRHCVGVGIGDGVSEWELGFGDRVSGWESELGH